FEVSVSRKHRGCNQIKFVDRLLNIRMERSRVADSGGATVTDEIESELIGIFLQPGFVEIIGNNPRTWGERSFHRRIDMQAALGCFFCKQSSRDHHAWITRVRATCDCRDQNAAMTDVTLPMR